MVVYYDRMKEEKNNKKYFSDKNKAGNKKCMKNYLFKKILFNDFSTI